MKKQYAVTLKESGDFTRTQTILVTDCDSMEQAREKSIEYIDESAWHYDYEDDQRLECIAREIKSVKKVDNNEKS